MTKENSSTPLDPEAVANMRQKRFGDVPLLIFQRSVDRARSLGELFDILDTMPPYPRIWDEESRRWVHTTDLMQIKSFR